MSAKPRYYHIYCDESSHINSENIVLGGLLLDRTMLPQLDERFAQFRIKWNAHAELKWTKVSKAKIEVYKALIDLFADSRPSMRFKAIVISGKGLRKLHSLVGSYSSALDALQTDLITRSFATHLRSGDQCSVIVDNRQSPASMNWVKDNCNSAIRLQRGFTEELVREIRSVDSRTSWQIQIADVLMGAVASELNRRTDVGEGSPAKAELLRYIKRRMKVDSFFNGPKHSRGAFAILHWDQIDQ